jgi:hypothetical protein
MAVVSKLEAELKALLAKVEALFHKAHVATGPSGASGASGAYGVSGVTGPKQVGPKKV